MNADGSIVGFKRSAQKKKKVVSSAGWITEPGSTACGAEVPASSLVPSAAPYVA